MVISFLSVWLNRTSYINLSQNPGLFKMSLPTKLWLCWLDGKQRGEGRLKIGPFHLTWPEPQKVWEGKVVHLDLMAS
jgi:hypothetical protein